MKRKFVLFVVSMMLLCFGCKNNLINTTEKVNEKDKSSKIAVESVKYLDESLYGVWKGESVLFLSDTGSFGHLTEAQDEPTNGIWYTQKNELILNSIDNKTESYVYTITESLMKLEKNDEVVYSFEKYIPNDN